MDSARRRCGTAPRRRPPCALRRARRESPAAMRTTSDSGCSPRFETSGPPSSRQTDQVLAGQRTAGLLDPAAVAQSSEVEGEEARVREQRGDVALRLAVVAG